MNNKDMSQPTSHTIITTFLRAYELGGIANDAIQAVREIHDLCYSPKTKPLPNKWQHFYSEVLPKQVQEQTEAFDFSLIECGRISPIIAEIESNIKSMAGDERERYIFGLLTPFADLANMLNPRAAIDRLKAEITDHKKALEMWESKPQDEPLFNINGEQSGTPKEQAKACKQLINWRERDIERLHDISRRFCEIIGQPSESGTIEYYCGVWVSAAIQFANRLDALLLTYGVDLLQLQETSGIYLKDHRVITDVEYYIGSIELVKHYINSLPPGQRATSPATTKEPSTERAKTAFERAVKAGYMKKTATGYQWLYNNASKVSLGYFLVQVYNPEGTTITPFMELERLFGVKRLDRAVEQATSVKKPQRWREPIDELLDNI